MVARWRKQPNETGLREIVQNPRGLQLRESGVTLLHVAPIMRGFDVQGWYWYGLGKNTCSTPKSSIEEAKADASEYYKQWRAEQQR